MADIDEEAPWENHVVTAISNFGLRCRELHDPPPRGHSCNGQLSGCALAPLGARSPSSRPKLPSKLLTQVSAPEPPTFRIVTVKTSIWPSLAHTRPGRRLATNLHV
jgi:hypothetical protein